MSYEEELSESEFFYPDELEFQDNSDSTETIANELAREKTPALAFLLYFCFWCHIINNLITSTVRSLREYLKPRPTVLTSLSLGQYGVASVCDFPVTTSLSIIEGVSNAMLRNGFQFPKDTWIQRRQHQIQKFVLKP